MRRVILAVADGVGGAQKGEEASKLCTDTLVRYLAPRLVDPQVSLQELVIPAFLEANQRLMDSAAQGAAMASTLTACVIEEQTLSVAHVGDSRAYLFRQNQVLCLTKDHNETVSNNVLTRWIGQDNLQIDQGNWPIGKGDIVAICSDGLTKFLRDEELLDTIIHKGLREGCQGLVALARSRGSRDDISVVAVVAE